MEDAVQVKTKDCESLRGRKICEQVCVPDILLVARKVSCGISIHRDLLVLQKAKGHAVFYPFSTILFS